MVIKRREPRLRVLSYNIHKGFSSGRRRFVLARIREAIRTVKADLVFLQEVLGEHEEHARTVEGWPTTSQFEYLADSVWPHFAYGRNAVYDSGHHGNAILSRYPIVSWENIDISASRFESRGILHTVIDTGTPQGVHALCLHLGLSERIRRVQLERLVQRVRTAVPNEEPMVIAGDFNDWPVRASDRLAELVGAHEVYHAQHGKHARTFPSSFPLLMLDRIYCRGLEATNARVLTGRPWNTLSDHAALYAELELAA